MFFCQLHAHTCPLYNVLLEVVCCCFPRNDILLNITLFVASQGFISPVFVSAAVSEIRELNQNKKEIPNKNSEIGYFHFNPFPAHTTYPFFNQRYIYLLSTELIQFVRSSIHHKLKVIMKISLSTLKCWQNLGHPYIYK